MRTARRSITAALVAIAALVGVACEPSLPTQVRSTPYRGTTITEDHGETYRLSARRDGVRITAPWANQHTNLRIAVVKDGAPKTRNQQACMTWAGSTDRLTQAGVVLRSRNLDGRMTAIMVTNNIIYRWRGAFNVHLADSAAPNPLVKVAGANLPAFLDPAPLPWRICARVNGTTVELKAWSIPVEPRIPRWGDPRYGYAIEIPPDWVYRGQPGAYIGHLTPRETTMVSMLRTRTLPP